MDWSQYRSSHLKTYGPTSRSQLSKDYQNYKRSLNSKTSPKKLITSKIKNKITSPKSKNKLTLFNIEKMAKNKKFLIVVLYADWCGHCRDMKEKLGSKMKNTDKIMFYNENTIDDSLKEYFPR